MKRRRKHVLEWVFTLNLIFLVWALPEFTKTVWAHSPKGYQEELRKGPHGGLTARYGKNYVEFVVEHDNGDIVLFLFDKDMKGIPLPNNYSATGYLNISDGSIVWITFRAAEEDTASHLEAETGLKDIGSFRAVISIKDGENRENFRFKWVPATHQHDPNEDQNVGH